MPIIVLIILSLTGGIGYASKSALPGDTLYPVKTEVVEPLETSLAFGAQAKAAAHLDHAMERLHELAQLEAEGKVSRHAQVLMKNAIEHEVSNVNTAIETLNSNKDYTHAQQVAKTLSDGLKKSDALKTIYGNLVRHAESIASTPESDTQVTGRSAQSTVPAVQVEPTTNTTTVAPPAAPTTTKYVPKLLPQRANISRGDDDEEDD